MNARALFGLQVFSAAAAALVFCAPPLRAQTVKTWTGGDGDFYAPTHWDTGSVPGATDIAVIANGSTATIAANAGDHALGDIQLGPTQDSQESGHVIMNGGTLRIGQTQGDPKAVIGFSAKLSTFIMNGGTILFDGPDAADLAGSTSSHGINELDWEVGEKGMGRFEMHNDAVFHAADDLKIAENALGQGTCLIDGHAKLSAGSGISISGNGGIEQSMVVAGDALVEAGNSMGAGSPLGHTDEGYLTLAFGNSLAKLTVQDNAVMNIRRLTAREGQSTLIVKDHAQFHIFDVLTGKGGSPADRPAVTGPNSTFASLAASDTNLVSTITLQDDAQMTVNSNPDSGPTKGLAISGQRDSGNNGGRAVFTMRDRAKFRVEQDLMIGTGASAATSDGTLEVIGPSAQVEVGGNLDMAVDLDGNVAGTDADGAEAPGKATLRAVITGSTQTSVNITGIARIAHGGLAVKLDGFTPTGGEVYSLIKAASIDGKFASTNLTEAVLPAGLSWEVEYTATAVNLKVNGQSAQGAKFTLSALQIQAGKLHLVWTGPGALVSSDTVKGTYTPVAGASGNSADVPIDGNQRFYQIKQ